jgi:hypothetical protein
VPEIYKQSSVSLLHRGWRYLGKRLGNIGLHFKAARANRRRHGCSKRGTRGTELGQRFDRFLCDTCDRASPAGMNCGDSAYIVGQQDADTVSRKHTQDQGICCRHTVGLTDAALGL